MSTTPQLKEDDFLHGVNDARTFAKQLFEALGMDSNDDASLAVASVMCEQWLDLLREFYAGTVDYSV